jgi:chromosome partitioning protein
MAKIISIFNQKGGVSKTTTTANLSKALVLEGKKVLAIDWDPQASLSIVFGIDEPDINDEYAISKLVMDVYDNDNINKDKYINTYDSIDFFKSSIELSAVEMSMVTLMARDEMLKNAIKLYENDYDYILIDCPPSLGPLSINALVASNTVLIPLEASFLSVKGLQLIISSISKVKRHMNKDLWIEGILLTRIEGNTNVYKSTVEMIEKAYGNVLETKIPKSVAVAEATEYSKTIFTFQPNNAAAEAYRNLAKEILKKNEQ